MTAEGRTEATSPTIVLEKEGGSCTIGLWTLMKVLFIKVGVEPEETAMPLSAMSWFALFPPAWPLMRREKLEVIE